MVLVNVELLVLIVGLLCGVVVCVWLVLGRDWCCLLDRVVWLLLSCGVFIALLFVVYGCLFVVVIVLRLVSCVGRVFYCY